MISMAISIKALHRQLCLSFTIQLYKVFPLRMITKYLMRKANMSN